MKEESRDEFLKKDNLARMISFIKTIPDKNLQMVYFSNNDNDSSEELMKLPLSECGSMGCVVGHSVHLDADLDHGKYYHCGWGFDYKNWSIDFLFNEPKRYRMKTEAIWDFMFASRWINSVSEAVKRMEYVMEHEDVPDWYIRDDHHTYGTIMSKYIEMQPVFYEDYTWLCHCGKSNEQEVIHHSLYDVECSSCGKKYVAHTHNRKLIPIDDEEEVCSPTVK